MSGLGDKPAYPRPHSKDLNGEDPYAEHEQQEGMSIRTHAAIEAMKGLLSNPEIIKLTTVHKDGEIKPVLQGMNHFEKLVIEHADALIKELEA